MGEFGKPECGAICEIPYPVALLLASKYNSGAVALGDQVEQLQRRGGEDIETSSMLPQDQRWADITMTSLIESVLIPHIYDARDKSVNYVVYTKPAICSNDRHTDGFPRDSGDCQALGQHVHNQPNPGANHINLFPSRSCSGVCVTIFNILK